MNSFLNKDKHGRYPWHCKCAFEATDSFFSLCFASREGGILLPHDFRIYYSCIMNIGAQPPNPADGHWRWRSKNSIAPKTIETLTIMQHAFLLRDIQWALRLGEATRIGWKRSYNVTSPYQCSVPRSIEVIAQQHNNYCPKCIQYHFCSICHILSIICCVNFSPCRNIYNGSGIDVISLNLNFTGIV